MIKISEADLAQILEVAERVAKRTGCKVVLRHDRIILVR